MVIENVIMLVGLVMEHARHVFRGGKKNGASVKRNRLIPIKVGPVTSYKVKTPVIGVITPVKPINFRQFIEVIMAPFITIGYYAPSCSW